MAFCGIAGRKEVRPGWRRVPSHGKIGECKDLSSAIVLAHHISCKCAFLFYNSLSRRRHLSYGQFAEVDDVKEAICSEVALSDLSQVCFD